MKRTAALAALTLIPFVLAGCGDDDDPRAELRVVHASPNAPAVDVRVDGDGVLSGVPYLGASDHLGVDAGDRDIEVLVAGTETVVISATLPLEEDTSTTVLATGLVADIAPLVLEDDRSAPAAGQAKLRVVHGAPSAPTVDVYVTAPGAALTQPTLEDVPFRGASGYLSVPAGNYQVRVTVANTTTVAIDTGAVAVPAGAVLTAVAVDAPGGGTPFDVLVLDDAR